MKIINIPISDFFSLTTKSRNIYDHPDDGFFAVTDFKEMLKIARDNGSKILYATTTIEKKINTIIIIYFFGSKHIETSEQAFFVDEILQSSNLTYSFKKNLTHKIINNCNLLKGKKKSDLQSNLKKIMDWRNAFAHGDIVYDASDDCTLRYYSSGLQIDKLDDCYWDLIEKCFIQTNNFIEEATEKLLTLRKNVESK